MERNGVLTETKSAEQLLQLHLDVLQQLLQGKPFQNIAAQFKDEFERLGYLDVAKKAGWISFDDRGDLIAAYPVSPKKTSWKVDVENIGTGYAMCAIDALGMAFTFGKKTTIETMDQTTKQPLIIIMNPDSEKEWTEFKDYYVSYKKFANINETTCNAALNQCPFIHIHSSLSSVPQDPSIEVLTFMDALERAKSRFSPEGMLQQMMEKESKETTDTATKTESED